MCGRRVGRYLNCVTVSPDGSLCASGGKDGTAMLWDLQVLPPHPSTPPHPPPLINPSEGFWVSPWPAMRLRVRLGVLRRRRAVGPAGGEAPLLAGGGRHHQRPALLPEPLLALRRHRQVRRVLRVREREREPKRQPRRPGQRNARGEIFCELIKIWGPRVRQ